MSSKHSAFLQPIVSALASKYLPFVLAALAIVLAVPSLWHGLIMDDLIHRAWLLGPNGVEPTLLKTGWIPADSGSLIWALNNLFSWFGRNTDLRTLMESGIVPWWTCDSIHVSFWRPLASLSHWLDYQLWPNSTSCMHAQSILWYALAVFLITLLYRELIGQAWIAGLAAFLFTFEDALYTPHAWLANRHAVLSLVFGVLALLAHHRRRSSGSRMFAILSPILLFCTLISSEQGLGIFAYFVSYALFIDRASLRNALFSLLPGFTVLAIWRIVYGLLGHGVSCTGMYVDPIKDPIMFAAGFLQNAPVMLAALWTGQASIAYNFLSPTVRIEVLIAAFACVLILFIAYAPLFLKLREVRFWAIGMLLALIPACGSTLVDDRLLLYVIPGAMALIAIFVGSFVHNSAWAPIHGVWHKFSLGICVFLVAIHILCASFGHVIRPFAVSYFKRYFLNSVLPDASDSFVNKNKIVILNAPNPTFIGYFPFMRSLNGSTEPLGVMVLAPAFAPIEVFRADLNTLILSSRTESLLSMEEPLKAMVAHDAWGYKRASSLYRPEGYRMNAGDTKRLSDVTIKVIETGKDGFPRRVAFSFNAGLPEQSTVYLRWDWHKYGYNRFMLPSIGKSVTIPGPSF